MPFNPWGSQGAPPCLSCPWAGTEAPGWGKEKHEKWCANLGVYGSWPHQVGDRGDGCRRRQTFFLMMSLESWGHYWVGRQNYPPLCKSLRHPEAPLENWRHPTTEAWVFVFFKFNIYFISQIIRIYCWNIRKLKWAKIKYMNTTWCPAHPPLLTACHVFLLLNVGAGNTYSHTPLHTPIGSNVFDPFPLNIA